MAGIVDFFAGGEDISTENPDLSAGARGLMDSAYQRANQPVGGPTARQISAPTEAQIAAGTNTLGSSDAAMARALSSRIGRAYNQKTQGLRASQGLREFERGFQNKQDAFAYQEAYQRVKMRNAQMQMQVAKQNAEARAAALRSILGLVGTGLGMYFGGSAGAAAGSKLGQGGAPQAQQMGSAPMGDSGSFQTARGPRMAPLKDGDF